MDADRDGRDRDEPGRDGPGRDEPGRDEPGRDEPDGAGIPDPTNLVRLTPVDRPVPVVTAMCCVCAHREASGRVWYRVTATPDISRLGTEATWVQSRLAAVLADVRAFLRDVDRPPPT